MVESWGLEGIFLLNLEITHNFTNFA